MKVLLQVNGATKSYASRVLFEDAQFTVNEKEHIGVIGPNGAGKSTLLKSLVSDVELDSGQITRSQGLVVGFLRQEEHGDQNSAVEDFVLQKAVMPSWDVKSLGTGLGLTEEHFSKQMSDLSGGYRMRCKLLALLAQEPDLLLLDEPTNYLDLESLLVLEEFLKNYKKSYLLISHDREFLKKTTNHILEIENGNFTKYKGNIEEYFEYKALTREQQLKEAQSIEAKKKEIKDFAAKFGAKASKAKQVQSRLKQLNKMDSISIASLPISAKIKIPKPVHTGKQIIHCEDLKLGYEEKTVLKSVNLTIQRGDHVGVVGVNGAGKSTLLKGISGHLEAMSGRKQLGHNVDIGYFAQHVAESLYPEDTVEQAMGEFAHSEILPQDVKDMAGSLLFSNDDIKKKVKVLSGGEKARVALGQILLKKSPCLLLDEPTNHLDFHTVEALTEALKNYEGTLLIVSHDRSFIQRVSSKILEIRNGEAEIYPGSYEEYVWSLQKGGWSDKSSANVTTSKPSNQPDIENKKNGNYKEQKKELNKVLRTHNKRLKEIESQLNKEEKLLKEFNEQIVSAQGDDAQTLGKSIHQSQSVIEELENKWMEVQEQIQDVQTEISELMQ